MDYFIGYIVKNGNMLNVPVPVNQAIVDIIHETEQLITRNEGIKDPTDKKFTGDHFGSRRYVTIQGSFNS